MNKDDMGNSVEPTTRPLYIWGPQLTFMGAMTKIGPCELWELTSLAEAFVFAQRLAAVKGTKNVITKELGEDLILTDIVYEAQKAANLDSDSAIVQWETAVRHSGAEPQERVVGVLSQFNRGEQFIEAAGEDDRKFFQFFFSAGFDICPSPEMVVPFISGGQMLKPEKMLTSSIDAILRQRIELIGPLLQSRIIYVPPLTAILLNRCKSPDDIPEGLMQLRKDFREAQETIARYQLNLTKASNLGEQLDAIRELEQAIEMISHRIVTSEGGVITKSIIRHIWDVAREANWVKLFTEPIDLLWKYLEKRNHRRLATHFVDIYRQLREIPAYHNLLKRVFGEKRVDYEAFNQFMPIQRWIEENHFPYNKKVLRP